MADKKSTIIVKKIKKGHERHHGGSWKVAYADFVTAMMAFFLLMWLLAMVSPEKRAALAEYFKHFSLFEKSGQSFMMEGQQQLLQKGGEDVKTFDFGEGKAALTPEDLKEKLKKAIEEKLRALKEQAMVDIYEGGVRIQLVDLEGKSMFQPGSAQLTPSAKEILKLVGENIKDLPNRIAVEGHTDASPLKVGRITNWELSTDRASSARRELESNGIDPTRIARVVGYADTELLYKDKPDDPRNRRISIILLQSKVQMPEKPLKKPEPEPEVKETTATSPPPPPVQTPKLEPEVKKPPVEKPVSKQEPRPGIIPGIKPKEPIEIKRPIDIPGVKPDTQPKITPLQPVEQPKKQIEEKPVSKIEKPVLKPQPILPSKPVVEQDKKPVEKPAPKEQKKDSIKPDIGIKPIKPIVPVTP
jgi:chemotaxis protein MotB